MLASLPASFLLKVNSHILPGDRMGAENPEDEEEKPKKLTKAMAENMFDQIMNDEGGI